MKLPRFSPSKHLLLPLALALTLLITYWPILSFPFVQDDWDLLLHFQTNDPATVIRSLFSFGGKLFYRPLSQLYLFSMYALFGIHPLPFHLAALLVHLLNSLLVANIVKTTTGDEGISFAAGLLYASAIAVHLEPLTWAVGIYDLGGACFFLLSVWLFLKDRPRWSAAAYLVALLFKETTVLLPAVLLAYALVQDVPLGLRNLWRKHRLTFLPYLLVLGLYLFVKGSALPLSLPADHPYAIDLWGGHLGRNLYVYAAWSLQAVFPFWYVHSLPFKALFSASILLGIVAVWASRREWSAARSRLVLFLLLWFAIGLLPLLTLPNHRYRYYLTYALPAVLAGLVLLADALLGAIHRLSARKNWILVAGVALVLITAVLQSYRILGQGLAQVTLADGTNGLVKRAATVEIVRGGLLEQLPSPPERAVILLGGVDLWAFSKDSGPRVWYDDPGIRVYALEDLRTDAAGIYIDSPIEDQTQTYTGSAGNRIDLDPTTTFAFQLVGDRLTPVQTDELKRSTLGD